ncbi:MAG: ATP-dependent DNA ligase [Thermoproteales archaeon]|nr:ATP-dependent DNA ligase [Thermoproteales archaeon]
MLKKGTLFEKFSKKCYEIENVSSRNMKIRLLSDFLITVFPDEIAIVARFFSNRIFPEYSNLSLDIGGTTVWKVLRSLEGQFSLFEKEKLTIMDVYTYLKKIAETSGQGSRKRKEMLFRSLLSRLSSIEKTYLIRLIFGELRIGVSEGLVLESISNASGIPTDKLRRAYMLLGDIGEIAYKAIVGGYKNIESVSLTLFRPIKPMLAEMAYSIREIFKEHEGKTALEFKYDGIRVQVHKKGEKIKVFTRRLNEITYNVPDIVNVVMDHAREKSLVLDGEIIGIKDGKPIAFQDVIRRIRRQRDFYAYLKNIPLKVYFFDIIYLNGEMIIEKPYIERWNILSMILDEEFLAKRIITDDLREADEFYKKAILNGHEGIIAKKLDSFYEPGKRGKKWLKLKIVDTIDCVILAAEWGHGRRMGWLSDYHLGVYDEDKGRFVMVGKTFKGLTDEEFEEITKKLLSLKIYEEGNIVYVQPKIVVEVAYSEIQRSPKYESGLALRFARITRIRYDKSPYEVTSLRELQERFYNQLKFKSSVDI